MQWRRATAMALAVIGRCGPAGYGTAEVTGRVTMDAMPVGDMPIQFVPEGTKADAFVTTSPRVAHRETDADRRYRVFRTDDKVFGAATGRYRVRIMPAEGGGGLVPAKYQSQRTPSYHVLPGANTFDTDVTSDPAVLSEPAPP